MTRDIRERISERLEELKKSARAASLDSGLGATAIKDILKRTDNSPTMATVEKLAVGLNVSPSWLAFEAGPKTLRVQDRGGLTNAGHLFTLARVDGAVKAGAFLRASAFDDDLGEAISAPRDPDYPAARQIAYRVDGDSMNAAKPRPIMDGDFIICAVWADLGIRLTDGQIVVVQQTIDGGRLRERSVKAVFKVSGGWELRPQSTNPEHEAIFVPENDAPDDGREVVVLALVRFVFNNQVIR
ncbi:LexA family transcriptional regulator [Methylobacterium sp. NMS14P]|uniref:LexA family transcriptional regulator n=1 Tax=Methylobacterium sp. NMS14P TaxID=2894310 RepID=UPI00235A1214|nr:LexA family transcriptional regulator [Methylobacterium sp. NMS14P]WCS27266.1 LexA family transcriptional regulator [Methylobacterium sp. NMS14P]